MLLPWAVEVLPILLHISLFLFFAGLAVFLRSVDLTIFKLVLSWVGVCTALYGCITIMPIFRHDSPYYTPLSFWRRCIFSGKHYRRSLVQGMEKRAEETAQESPSEIDSGAALMWTLDSLDEDHELERFFFGLPGFRSSKVVDDPLPTLSDKQKGKLLQALIGFLEHTLSSDLLTDTVKTRRAAIFRKSFEPLYFSVFGAFHILDSFLSRRQYCDRMAAEVVQNMIGWANNRDEDKHLVRAAVCSALVRVQQHDDSWFILASKELGLAESVLRDYAAHGDSLSLAILIHVTRQQFTHFWKLSWPWFDFLQVLLEAASKIDTQDTSLELRHEFCSLWNQIVRKMQSENDWVSFYVLGPIRNIYITLHRDTDYAPKQFSASTSDWDDILRKRSSYPLCNVAGHIHRDSAQPAHQAAIDNFLIPDTNPDSAVAQVMQGDASEFTRTVTPSPPETSAPAPPTSNLSTSPPSTIAVQHLTVRPTPSGIPGSPSIPALDDILPTDPASSSDSLVTSANHAPLSPEPDPSTPAPAASSQSHPRTSAPPSVASGPPYSRTPSAPDLDAAAEGDGGANMLVAFRQGADTRDSSSPFRITAPDFAPHSSSPLSVPDVAVAAPSRRSLDVERTGDGCTT